jgi:5-oxoprolinase (ATP-hydrolysing) subunit A
VTTRPSPGTTRSIDLNADLGEGFGRWRATDDDGLLEVVSSANVACGFHAGEPSTMARVVAAAAERGVAVGAQVSYADLRGFGRRRMPVSPDELTADVTYQLGALAAFCRAAGVPVAHVKPHGALYNVVVDDPEEAAAVVRAVAAVDPGLPVFTLPSSALAAAAAAAGLPVVAEAFLDRGYTSAGRLVRRGEPGDLLTGSDEVVARAVRLARGDGVVAADGTVLDVVPASLCVHGDTPDAVALARAVRAGLEAAQFPVVAPGLR